MGSTALAVATVVRCDAGNLGRTIQVDTAHFLADPEPRRGMTLSIANQRSAGWADYYFMSMTTPTQDETPIAAILHPDLRDAEHDDIDDLYRLVRYCESGDQELLKPLSLDRLDLLYARYGALNWRHVRALTMYRDQLRDERVARIGRREKVGIVVLAALLGSSVG